MTTPTPTGHSTNLSTLAVVGAIVAVIGLLTAAALFLTGDDALQRLAIVAAAVGIAVPGLLALVRADQAVTQTNGTNQALTATNLHLHDNLPGIVQAAVDTALGRAAVAAAPPVAGGGAPDAGAPLAVGDAVTLGPVD